MKKLLLFFLISTFMVSFSWAQREVSGTVTGADEGLPLPGVSILIVGTTTGTVTDADGNDKLSVPSSGATLRYSYIGYVNQEITVGNQSVIDIVLAPDATQLQEVVVTSLGIERETKALGYSITEVDGEALTEARENNLANQLQGRVAGVNVSSVSGGPASSTRVIIRGNKSLQGNNQPLYVVDGIPMDNSDFGQAGMWGGRDEGDGMSSINPDDIESIQVLKGANAAALYGARAANGVINITTKKGTARKGIGVEFLSNYVFETVYDQRDYQEKYGQGGYVRTDPDDPESPRIAVAPRTQQEAWNWGTSSWGAPLGSVANAIQFDGVSRPYTNQGDNWDRYYRTGSTWTNTVALTGGSDKQNFRFSVSDLRNESIIPNTGFDRQNLSLSSNSKFGEKLTLTAKVLYSHEVADNRPYLSDSPANGVLAMYYIPANINVDDYRGDPNKLGGIAPGTDEASLQLWGKSVGEEFQQANNNWHQNPWWTAYQFDNDDTRDRIITSGQLRYDITDWLYAQGRIGMDWMTRRETDLVPQGTGYQRGGSMSEAQTNIREINADYMIGFNKMYGRVNVNAFFGGNIMRRKYEDLNLNGNGFNVPFFEAINNTITRSWGFGFSESGINSIYGQAEIGYNGFLYLTGSFRTDWFSVLNPEFNKITYPSIGASFVFSDAIQALPSWLSFGKVRASWAQVGNVTIGPYSTNLTYSLNGNTHLGYTMASFSSAMSNNGLIPNPQLQPLLSTELEFGLDVRFLDNRLGIDFTYYEQKTTDDILNATISRASGFGRTSVNLGEMTNKGIEVLLNGTPVRGALTWDISLNFARNTNEVVSLIEGTDELIVGEPRNRHVFIKHIVGQPFGMITGSVQMKSPSGEPVFYSDGRMRATDEFVPVGNGVPDWTGGLNNSFTWKNFNLSFLIDFKIGGDIISGSNNRLTGAGLHKQTLTGREGEAPLTISGVTQTGSTAEGEPIFEPINMTLTPSQAQSYWGNAGGDADGITDLFLYDAGFGKLRQLTFGYNFPRSLLSKTPFNILSLSFVGGNLFVLWKDIENVDPESSYSNQNSQGLEYFGMPAVRSYGFNLKVGF
ncbi:MAG: SusC/RagA family TonB-linked outer membrane protein [Cyclobacteriaceae bacterium]|nr:SusC/RagA family TonB-linked outer membrane protein [Cyclobacteriaceae bacterium]